MTICAENATHNRRSIRLQGHDYSQNGAYFITICTQNRACLLGKITAEGMLENDIWHIVEKCWIDIPNHFSHISLDEYVIMPNHIHGILNIVGARGMPCPYVPCP